MGAAMHDCGEFFCVNKDCREMTYRASLRAMRTPYRCVLVLILTALASTNSLQASLSDTQWKTLMQVPAEVTALLESCRQDLASGATPRMLAGMDRYNKGLTEIILVMGRQYYAPALEKKTVDRFVEAVNVQADFESLLSNPTGEFPGTIAPLEVQAQVAEELEKTIFQMAETITEDKPDFPIKKWKSQWQQALNK
jgi:hypothetical protein